MRALSWPDTIDFTFSPVLPLLWRLADASSLPALSCSLLSCSLFFSLRGLEGRQKKKKELAFYSSKAVVFTICFS